MRRVCLDHAKAAKRPQAGLASAFSSLNLYMPNPSNYAGLDPQKLRQWPT